MEKKQEKKNNNDLPIKKKKYGSLSWRLSIILILSSFPALIILSYLVSVNIKSILQKNAYDQLRQTTSLHRNYLENDVHQAVVDLKNFSNRFGLLVNNSLTEGTGNTSQLVVDNLQPVVDQYLVNNSYFSHLAILDTNKHVVLSSGGFSKSVTDLLSADVFDQVKQKGFHIGQSLYFSDQQKNSLLITTPIISNNLTIGFIVGYFDFDKLTFFANDNSINTYLIDFDGRLIAVDSGQNNRQLGQIFSRMKTAIERVADSYEYRNDFGKSVLGIRSVIPDLKLGLTSELETEIVFTPWSDFFNLASGYLIVILVGTVIFGVVFGWFISSPIKKIVAVSKKISAGEFGEQVVVDSDTEIGSLAEAFNEMTSKLINLTKTQKKTIDQRTGELEKVNKQNSAILFAIGDGVLAIDKDQNIISLNQTAEKIFGYKAVKVLGKKYLDYAKLYIKDVDNKVFIKIDQDPLLNILTDGKVYKAGAMDHLYYKHKDGKYTPVRITATPIIENNQVVGAMAVFTDITLENDIDNIKSEFISVVSHKLRTPLTSIRWFTEMLLDGEQGPVNPEQLDYLRQIFESDERMIILINNLISVIKLETGKGKAGNKEVSAVELAEKVISEEKPIAKAKNINVDLQILSEPMPEVLTDQLNLRQAIKNLVSNAIKYNRKANGKVQVKLGMINCSEWKTKGKEQKNLLSKDPELSKKIYDRIADNGCKLNKDFLFVVVSDTGIGIAEKDFHKIFEKFYRGSNVVSLDTDGTGLGLYVVKLFADRSGGCVWFESKEKEGSTFYFTIPVEIKNPSSLS